jgi:thiamine-monophosphate kinase
VSTLNKVDRISDLGEFGFVERITPGCVLDRRRVVQGIGDDCGVTRCTGGLLHLVTTDLLVEKAHFLRTTTSAAQLGHKALGVNLSDIAAMGGTARDAYVALAIPPETSVEFLDDLYRGMKDLAARFGVSILGGDTSISHADMVISITVTGDVEPEHVLFRHGALEGDTIFVTGPLGDSAAGLHAVTNGQVSDDSDARVLACRHLEPVPHLVQGRVIAQSGWAHAMIDSSDGFSSDLGHICDQSGVGFVIEEDALPLSGELKRYARRHGLDPVSLALHGGEDYVLIVAGAADLAAEAARHSFELVAVGVTTGGHGRTVRRPDGTLYALAPKGWDHFAHRRSPCSGPSALGAPLVNTPQTSQ